MCYYEGMETYAEAVARLKAETPEQRAARHGYESVEAMNANFARANASLGIIDDGSDDDGSDDDELEGE